jgi:hypothetical protein
MPIVCSIQVMCYEKYALYHKALDNSSKNIIFMCFLTTPVLFNRKLNNLLRSLNVEALIYNHRFLVL